MQLQIRKSGRRACSESAETELLAEPRQYTGGMSKAVWQATLNIGSRLPVIGLGTWLTKPGEAGQAVETALRVGYRHIDCAQLYKNEHEIGQALQKSFKEGVCKREDVFITSKLWNTEHSPSDVHRACYSSLKGLQLDYLDLYLVHWPVAIRKGVQTPNICEEDKLGYDPEREAARWEAMEDLVAKGLVRAIGISNFSITKTERLLQTAKIVPAVNQVECHPYFQQQKLKEYCESRDIQMEAYAPLGSPGRTRKNSLDPVVMEDPVIAEVALRHGASPAQICLAFALHRGIVVIPKTVNPARISENIRAAEIKLDQDDMSQLRAVDRNTRLLQGVRLLTSEFTSEHLWDTTKDNVFNVAWDYRIHAVYR